MHVRVGDFVIRSDSVCFSVCEIKVVQAKQEGHKGIAPKPENIGKEREVVIGYYGKLSQALTALADKMTMSDDIDSVGALLSALERIHALIAKFPEVILVKSHGMEAQASSEEPENSPQGE